MPFIFSDAVSLACVNEYQTFACFHVGLLMCVSVLSNIEPNTLFAFFFILSCVMETFIS